MDVVTQKEIYTQLVDQLELQDESCKESLTKILDYQSEKKMQTAKMMQLEEDTYELTIMNQARVMVKDRLVEMVPVLVSGNKGQLQEKLSQVDDDQIRSKLSKLLRKYKLLS